MCVAGNALLAYPVLSHPALAPYASLMLKPSPPAGGLRARFFGVTTILVDDGETAVMTDGFFSRPGLLSLLFTRIAPDSARIEDALKRGNVSKLAAVLVAHSHYDHAQDCAIVAERTGALLVGSESTANIGRGHHKLATDRIRTVKGGDQLSFKGFTIEIFESPHSPGSLYPGDIAEPLRPPVRGRSYKGGPNYSFLLRHARGTMLIQPSANFAPGLLRSVKADVIFLSIGALGKQTEDFARDYWREVVQATGAKLIILIHWDDFLRPLDGPLRPMLRLMDDFDAAMRWLIKLAEADGVALGFMPLFDACELP